MILDVNLLVGNLDAESFKLAKPDVNCDVIFAIPLLDDELTVFVNWGGCFVVDGIFDWLANWLSGIGALVPYFC
jgi:hypothetical protein